MLVKIIVLTPILYFSALLQSSFLPHFAIFGYMFNLLFILAILFSFFIPSMSLATALLGGLYTDILSTNFLGFNALILTATVIFIRVILRRYVKVPFR